MADEKEKYPKRNMEDMMNDPNYREKLLNAMCVYAGPDNPTTNTMNMMMVYAGPAQMNKQSGLTGFFQMSMNQQQAQEQTQQKVQQQAQELKQAQENGEMPKFCPNCGSPLRFKGKFCSECGGKLFV